MRMRPASRSMALLIAALAGSPGCSDSRKDPPPPMPKGDLGTLPVAPPPAVVAPEMAASPGAPGPGMPVEGRARCPSAVPGASTVIAAEGAALVLTVTGDSEAATPIKARAHQLAEVQAAAPTATSPCPELLADTAIEVVDLDNGVRISLAPTANGQPAAALEIEASRRLAALGQARAGQPVPPGGKPAAPAPGSDAPRPPKPPAGNAM
jgi:hypothetical protein